MPKLPVTADYRTAADDAISALETLVTAYATADATEADWANGLACGLVVMAEALAPLAVSLSLREGTDDLTARLTEALRNANALTD